MVSMVPHPYGSVNPLPLHGRCPDRLLQWPGHICRQAVALFVLPAGWGYCLYYAHASVWLGAEGGAANQVLRDPL